jgi:hypothetical protein
MESKMNSIIFFLKKDFETLWVLEQTAGLAVAPALTSFQQVISY